MKRLIALSCLALSVATCIQQPRDGDGPHVFAPFNWQINTTGSSNSHITVTLYDINGQVLGTAFDGVVDSSGRIDLGEIITVTKDSTGSADTVRLPSKELPKGLYFLRVKTPDTTFTRAIKN